MARMLHVHPVLAVRDVVSALSWYCGRLEFELLFVEPGPEPRYAGIGRDGVEIHLQWHGPDEWDGGLTGAAYRFLVDDPDELHTELRRLGAVPDDKVVTDTEWGTREFGFYDPDANALFFYRDLT